MTIVLLLLAIGPQADQRWDFDRRLGVVHNDPEGACLAINAAGLRRWDPIFVVGLEERPLRTFAAQVESSAEPCGLPNFKFAYRVSFLGGAPEAGVLGAAVGVFRIVAYPDGRIAFRLSPAPTPHLLRFTKCVDASGLRVAAISDHPSPDTQVWSTLVLGRTTGAMPCA